MIKNSYSSTGSVGVPSPTIPKGTLINNLTNFIENTLVTFQINFVRNVNDAEEAISEELTKYLTHYSKNEVFLFIKETMQRPSNGRIKRVDIGVFILPSDKEAIFTIEAKRLPTPTTRREREYVSGTDSLKPSGGIERFKRSLHGIGIDHSAIVGYVQDYDFNHWERNINQWIDDLIQNNTDKEITWTTGDKLINKVDIFKDKVCKFTSKSSRHQTRDILLRHYFIDLK